MDRATMVILLVLLFAMALYGFRLARGERTLDENETDTGSAILDFARAFPGEAIRSLHMTADHEAVFVRLHDNRSGFMRNMGNHHACLLLDAKTLQVEPLESGDGLKVIFDEWPKLSGDYRFKTQEEAAEVALWLLASLQIEPQTEALDDDDRLSEPLSDEEDQSETVADDSDIVESHDPLEAFTSGPEKDSRD